MGHILKNSMAHFNFKDQELLQQLINSIILEAQDNLAWQDQTRKVGQGNNPKPQLKKTFDFEEFKQLPTISDQINYAQSTLPKLGTGSGRAVFRLNEKAAIKIAIPDQNGNASSGQKQNKAELGRCSADPETNKYLAKVYPNQSDEVDGNWIVVDLAKPINEETWQRLTKINWKVFESALQGVYSPNASDANKHHAQILGLNNFFKTIIATINNCKFVASDVASINNWGIVNGLPVIIDYGYTTPLTGKINITRSKGEYDT